MKKLTLSIAILLIVQLANAQITFQKTYNLGNGITVGGISQTADTGYVVCGSYGAGNTYLLKTDRYGTVQWNHEISNSISLFTNAMAQTSDGGFILCGSTKLTSLSDYDVALTRLDVNGNILWSKAFGGGVNPDHGFAVKQTNDGGFVACGQNFNNSSYLSYLVKTDSMGALQWTKTFIDTTTFPYANSQAWDVLQRTDNSFIICGETMANTSLPIDKDGYIIKADSFGNIIWSKVYRFPGLNSFRNVKETNDGGYILTGWVDTPGDTLPWRDILLMRTDSSGNVLWTKTYGNFYDDVGSSVITLANNKFLLCGARNYNASSSNCAIIKTDSVGNIIWSNSFYSLSNYTYGNKIVLTNDGGYLVGTTRLQSFPPVVYLIKTDSAGMSNCADTTSLINVSTISFTISSPFITSVNDTTNNLTLTSINSPYSETTLCFTTGNTDFEYSNPSFSISPNPTNYNFTISFENTILKGNVEIINVIGEKVFEEDIFNKQQIQINLKNISSGIYFVKVFDSKKQYCKKLIVEHD
jgi:hypothetical protein